MRTPEILAFVTLPLALGLAACGTEQGGTVPPSETEGPTSAETAPPAAEQAPPLGSSPGARDTAAGHPLPNDARFAGTGCFEKSVFVPAMGTTLTIEVDTRSLSRAHFMANARALAPESPASFELAVAEAETTAVEGWDVCVGQESPECFANVETALGKGVRRLALTMRTKTAVPSSGTLSVCVFDPLE